MGLILNLDYIEVADIADTAEAVRIGTGAARMPRSWLKLLTESPEEYEAYRAGEMRRDSG